MTHYNKTMLRDKKSKSTLRIKGNEYTVKELNMAIRGDVKVIKTGKCCSQQSEKEF